MNNLQVFLLKYEQTAQTNCPVSTAGCNTETAGCETAIA
jgi:hypothetical protein